jgi:hypothetical protein
MRGRILVEGTRPDKRSQDGRPQNVRQIAPTDILDRVAAPPPAAPAPKRKVEAHVLRREAEALISPH